MNRILTDIMQRLACTASRCLTDLPRRVHSDERGSISIVTVFTLLMFTMILVMIVTMVVVVSMFMFVNAGQYKKITRAQDLPAGVEVRGGLTTAFSKAGGLGARGPARVFMFQN